MSYSSSCREPTCYKCTKPSHYRTFSDLIAIHPVHVDHGSRVQLIEHPHAYYIASRRPVLDDLGNPIMLRKPRDT